HRRAVKQVLQEARNGVAQKRLVRDSAIIRHEIELLSSDKAQRHPRPIDMRQRTAAMLTAVDRMFAADLEEERDNDELACGSMRTLHSMTSNWTLVSIDKLKQRAPSGWSADSLEYMERAHSALFVRVRPSMRELSSPPLFSESLWRALLPMFGNDVKFMVLPRTAQPLSSTQRSTAKRARVVSMAHLFQDTDELCQCMLDQTGAVTEFAVVAVDVDESYERKLYESVRLNRHLLFVDVLRTRNQESDERVPLLSRAALASALHKTPEIYVPDVAGSAT